MSVNKVQSNGSLSVIASRGQFIQFSVMPIASADRLNQIIQFIGTTTADYTNGYFYQCNEISTGVYGWVRKDIQPSSGGGSAEIIKGYFNPSDNLFYEESTYVTPITGDVNSLYLSLDTDLLYRYNSTIFVEIGNYEIGDGLNLGDNVLSADTVTFIGTSAEWNNLTTTEKIKYNICNITDDMSESGGEGTTVIANPSGTATSELEKLQVDSVIYSVVTKAVNDLTNYYLKTETYTQTEVNNLIGAIATISFEVVATLPTTNIKTNVIYLVPSSDPQTSNVKDEYINLDGTTSGWELIGSTAIDLSGYVTTTDLNTALASYATLTDLGLKQDIIQVSTMPTASSDYVGKVYQYIGTTGVGIFTHGYFYECVEENSSYIWKELDVQASEIDDTITSINTTWSSNKISSEINGIDGSTVTPTDDIQTWLKCAELDEAYTTLSDVLADDDVMEKLFRSENASNYLARSTTWANDITANQTAMILIGANDYCANKLLEDSTWSTAICNSTYFESVLNIKVPIMTSDNTPVGYQAIQDGTYYDYYAYKAFDGNTQTANNIAPVKTSGAWLGIVFPNAVEIYKVGTIQNLLGSTPTYTCNIKVQYSDNGTTWSDTQPSFDTVGGDYKYQTLNDNYGKHKYWRIYLNSTSSGGTTGFGFSFLQFYGRNTKTTIYSAANDIVSFVDDEGAKVVTTDSTGKGEVTIVCKPNTDITFTSSVAKNPDNLSENYSKVVTVKANGDAVYVMPNNALYWYGYKSDNFEDLSTSNGWSTTSPFNPEFYPPTKNTNFIRCYHVTSSDGKIEGVGTKDSISGASKIHGIIKGYNKSDNFYGGYYSYTSKAIKGDNSTRINYVPINNPEMEHLEFDFGANAKYPTFWTINNRGMDIYAIWYDNGDDGNYDKADADLIAPVQKTLTAKKAYAVGEQFVYNQTLYKVTQAIAQGAQITIGTNAVIAGSVTEQISNLCIIDTNEHLIGSFMGAPLYRKAFSVNEILRTADTWVENTVQGVGVGFIVTKASIIHNNINNTLWYLQNVDAAIVSTDKINILDFRTTTVTVGTNAGVIYLVLEYTKR